MLNGKYLPCVNSYSGRRSLAVLLARSRPRWRRSESSGSWFQVIKTSSGFQILNRTPRILFRWAIFLWRWFSGIARRNFQAEGQKRRGIQGTMKRVVKGVKGWKCERGFHLRRLWCLGIVVFYLKLAWQYNIGVHLRFRDLHGDGDGGNPIRIRGKSAAMGTIIVGIPRGWNLLLPEIRGMCLENVQPYGF